MSGYHLMAGDCLESLKRLTDNSIDAIVTDPPYGLSKHKQEEVRKCLKAWANDEIYCSKGTGFMGKCLHPETEILTSKGWFPIPEIPVGALVASLNPDTKHLEYVKAIKKQSYDFDGNLLEVGGRSSKQVVTPNHMVWTGNSLVRADSLPNEFYLTNQATWVGKTIEYYEIEEKKFPIKPFLKFLGLWLGDGYVCNRKNQPEKQDFIGFSVVKKRKVLTIEKTLDELGVKYKNVSTSGKTLFYIYDAKLRDWLNPLGKATTKHIPNSLFELSSDLLVELYNGLVETDGCIQGKGQVVFSTSSLKLRDDFQRLTLHLGLSSTSSTHRLGGEAKIMDRDTNTSTSYRVSVCRSNAKFWMLKNGRFRNWKIVQPSNVKDLPYAGKVHCLTLEKNHIMLSRWEGLPSWTGNSWDKWVPGPEVWKECLRVLKPGGHMLVFAGTRSDDLMGMAIRLSGFEIRDKLMWVFGSGFPKSMNISKQLDKVAGAEREVVGVREDFAKAAKKYSGYGTGIKPAYEPIILARKPLDGNVAENVLKYSTGGLNIDGCRVGTEELPAKTAGQSKIGAFGQSKIGAFERGEMVTPARTGRFPANLILSYPEDEYDADGNLLPNPGKDEVVGLFPETKNGNLRGEQINADNNIYGKAGSTLNRKLMVRDGDSVSAARFFYCAKASNSDRNEGLEDTTNSHPTVKPHSLMRYLVRLITPPDGVVLDPFLGSGSTGKACMVEGFNFIGMEIDEHYLEISEKRIIDARNNTPSKETNEEEETNGETL